jgi:Ca2+-binding EF-hand superfamily protein
MKVKELIEKLEEFDPDHDVMIDLTEFVEGIDPHLDGMFQPDDIHEGSNWNIMITVKY